MGCLSEDLRDMGFVPTGEESPVHSDGTIWVKGHEMVCDETATVIDGNHNPKSDDEEEVETRCGDVVYRYENSGRVKLIGAFTSL